MSIVRARLKPYSLPLRDPWPSADGDVKERRGWILALEDDLGRVGLGDAAPFPGFGLETHASAGAGLRLVLSRLVGMGR
ncbi:MAG TPA: o-succinylbenzoate synthase, partial [Candidatus Binatia bacterium]|nr:o-succinylbenzoate synthase [Candidatus Binatia bacterium]